VVVFLVGVSSLRSHSSYFGQMAYLLSKSSVEIPRSVSHGYPWRLLSDEAAGYVSDFPNIYARLQAQNFLGWENGLTRRRHHRISKQKQTSVLQIKVRWFTTV
jgi:hypothetical protein